MHADKPKILVAEVASVIPVVEVAWRDSFALTYCTTMHDAERLLLKHFDVIVCGTHFAESQMFNLLRRAKTIPQSCHTPFLCVRVLDGELESTAFQSISIATRALGAAGFVDLNRWRRELGFDKARSQFRQLVFDLADARHPV